MSNLCRGEPRLTLDEISARAWRKIHLFQKEVTEAAKVFDASTAQYRVSATPDAPPQQRQFSALEKLPDEILLMIMENLDIESLFWLSHVSKQFLVLSFDRVFESKSRWHNFRRVADGLIFEVRSIKPARARTGPPSLRDLPHRVALSLPSSWRPENKCVTPPNESEQDEGEMMVDVMARTGRNH
ncbi:hypothetical protein F4777DRAFT_582219 [Nemania sp. FL0916]|nr:hypothetical protein F4777DRAFT_582219 [Nemania sp. FL0916]